MSGRDTPNLLTETYEDSQGSIILSEQQKQFIVDRNRTKRSQESEDDDSALSYNDKSESSRGLKLQVDGIDDM